MIITGLCTKQKPNCRFAQKPEELAAHTLRCASSDPSEMSLFVNMATQSIQALHSPSTRSKLQIHVLLGLDFFLMDEVCTASGNKSGRC